ncbi:MAG: transposase [Actinomycetia bacterium]|nr:transposase [Actinomycetes bacterium]
MPAGRQALLVVAHLRKNDTYAELACGFGVGTSTAYRYIREALDLLAAKAPTLEQAIEVARRKAFVILDGTLLRIDRFGMASGYDRAFYSGKHKAQGLNVQVIADPIGRLVWISPPLPGARHDMGAAREHGIIDAFTAHKIPAAADTAYLGAGPTVAVPQRRRLSAYSVWARFQTDPLRHHDRALKRILNDHADTLAACIDRGEPLHS